MNTTQKEKKVRLHLVDEYRGFWIINMLIYHGLWDWVYIFGYKCAWFESEYNIIWQQWGCWSFIFISGFCWQMSKHNFKRGLEVFFAGLLITVVTLIFMPESRVVFGVLTLLGSSMLLMIPCETFFKKIPPLVGATLSFLIFLFVYPINDGYLGFFNIKLITLPEELYSSLFSSYLGFTQPGFYSTDYFSLLPWFFMYSVGYFTYSFLLKSNTKPNIREASLRILSKSLCTPVGWVGRNSLIIYMLHQPIIYGLLTLLNYLITTN